MKYGALVIKISDAAILYSMHAPRYTSLHALLTVELQTSQVIKGRPIYYPSNYLMEPGRTIIEQSPYPPFDLLAHHKEQALL